MSEKIRDQHGRWRNVTVAFRVSAEEAELINKQVALSGLTKQEYITSRLLNREVVVLPNSRVQRALKNEMSVVYRELRRLQDASGISPELATVIQLLAEEFVSLGMEEKPSEVTLENSAINCLTKQ